MIGIYKITNPNGRVYIGQSQNIESRMQNYVRLDCKKQPRLYRSLLKYGYTNHIFKIIEECLFKNLNIRERYWQDYYNVTSKNGMNCYLTETHVLPRKLSEKTKNKISKSMLGKKNNSFKSNKLKQNVIRYKNGKIKYYKNKKSKFTSFHLVLNLETGIFYETATEAANAYPHYKKSTLMGYLRGHSPNKTNFIYV